MYLRTYSATAAAAAAAGTLTGTTLAANVVTSSLTTVGTLGSLGVTGTVTAGAFSGPLNGTVGAVTPAAGAFTTGAFSGTLQVSGTSTLSDDLVFNFDKTIRRNTADGADSGFVQVAGGGSGSTARGGSVTCYGNEHASTGKVQLLGGNVVGGNVEIYAAGALAFSVLQSDKKTYFGATLDTNLYRSAANVLATDDALAVALDFSVATSKFTVASATGNTVVAGTLTTNGGLQTFLANDSAGAGFRYVVVPNA